MRKILLIIIGLILWQFSSAKTITGKVIASDTFEELIGVSIMVKGTTIGTVTNVMGEYSIEVPGENDVLVFSFIGFTTQEVAVIGRKVIDVQLVPDIKLLEGVVVTALGIKRSEKALGYAVQNVKGDDVAQVKEPDIMNALSGKVSGVNIIQSSGAIGGGGSRVVIRGETSLAGNNDPLYIINGIVGNPNDIAPDDIESISVLKGPAAAALYGAKAGGGVVIITSKSGKGTDGIEVGVNSSVTFQTPLVLPEYQNKYGMGLNGEYSYYNGATGDDPYFDDVRYNWGPAFDGEFRSQFNGEKAWVAYPDNVKDFYEVGHIMVNNAYVASNTEKGNYRFSYTHTDQKGIMPNNGLNKNNLGLNGSFKITKGLTVSSNINFIRTNCANRKEVDVRFIQRNVDIAALKDYWVPGMEGEQQLNYRKSANNPYFELYENTDSYIDNKVVANATLNWEINDHFSLLGRYGANYINNQYENKKAKSTLGLEDGYGYYLKGFANSWDNTAEFLASYQTDWKNLNIKASIGGTHFRQEYNKLEGSTSYLNQTGVYNLNNRKTALGYLNEYNSALERNSLYGFINLDYKGKLFLDITRRDDWSSTLIPTNNHFIYPSVVASAIVSEIVNLPKAISYMKLRASMAQVGNDIPSPYFTVEDKFEYTYTDGVPSVSPVDIETDPNLKPEKTTGYEIGLDVRFLNNRLGIDITGYYSSTVNQIITLKKTVTSGGKNFKAINTGEVENKGLEISLNATPVKNNHFTWDLLANWSLDRAFVNELVKDDPEAQYARLVNTHLAVIDIQGERRGAFFGKSYQKAPNGERLYTPTGDTMLSEEQVLGNYNPDWMTSLNNNFTYDNLSLSFLLDFRYGGLIYNEIERKLNFLGLSEATVLNDREGLVPHGVFLAEDGSYQWLTSDNIPGGGQSGKAYWETQMEETVPENVLIDDTYLKLRELRLSYNLPKKWMDKTFMNSLTLSVVGRNLAVWSKVKHIDPETFGVASERNVFGGQIKVPGYANAKVPSVRSYGFTLNCKF